MKTCVLYCRVSTSGQALDGISLDAQKQRLTAWAVAEGRNICGLHVDAGISGKRADNRPALQEALEQACNEHAPLVVYSLSRLARSTKDAISIAERLDKAGADLVSLTEQIDTTTAAGKMVFRLLAVLAEFERDLVSERTKAALSHKKHKREKTGGHVPYGYRNENGVLVENVKEQQGVRMAVSLRSQGIAYREIARKLHAVGFADSVMNHTSVARIVKRHRKVGTDTQFGSVRPNGTKTH